jgi:ankyrin repeat protein
MILEENIHKKKFRSINFDNGLVFGASCQSGNIEMIKFLIENGINIHNDNDRPFAVACSGGKIDVVKIFIENKFDIHIDDDYALKVSCQRGHLDLVKFLISNGEISMRKTIFTLNQLS